MNDSRTFGLGKSPLLIVIAAVTSILYSTAAFAAVKDGQLQGKFNNIDITLEKAVLNGRTLQIDFKNDGGLEGYFSIFLPGEKGIVPEEKLFRYTKKDKHRNLIHVGYWWKNKVDKDSGSDSMRAGEYQVAAKFGKEEADNNIPVQVSLKNAKLGVKLRGKFVAQIEGLRLIDGHPDLRSDAIETLNYAVQLYLQDKLGKETEVKPLHTTSSTWFTNGRGIGGADARYKVNGGEEKFFRAWVSKKSGQWEVAKEIKINEFLQAHPLEEVDIFSANSWMPLAYRKLEEELRKEHPDKIFRSVGSGGWYRPDKKHGLVEITTTYVFDSKDQYKQNRRKYLLRRKDGQWFVDRRMDENEKLNVVTGEVEKK